MYFLLTMTMTRRASGLYKVLLQHSQELIFGRSGLTWSISVKIGWFNKKSKQLLKACARTTYRMTGDWQWWKHLACHKRL